MPAHDRRILLATWLTLLLNLPVLVALPAAATSVRLAEVVKIPGTDIARLAGYPINRLALVARRSVGAGAHHGWQPIPFQIDERDAEGQWVLERGPQPNFDTPRAVLDDNDVLLFMAMDAGTRVPTADLPHGLPVAEVSVHDPLTGSTRWAYLLGFDTPAPRAPTSYVDYDPATDRVQGAHVTLGFRNGTPAYLGIRARDGAVGGNLLDRFKVRATAAFLWGLLHFSRTEDDLLTEFVAWGQGPIRVIRRQRQRVRIGWGIRSPTFGSYTYFYRDFAELPVALYLNFPPTYFFGSIVIRTILDFRDLKGWLLLVPGLARPIAINGRMTAEKAALNQLPASWFALEGPHLTLLQTMDVSPSLASVRRRLLYREDSRPAPPEGYPGQEPGIGYQLDQWGKVRAGAHHLRSVSWALPAGINVREFVRAQRFPLHVTVRALPPESDAR
ncbi:MAG: hypothetical protein ACE5I7_06150 [Candidatus Binatia bacterium]